MTSRRQNLRAAGLMVAGVTSFCIGDAFVKELGARLPTGQIMALRGLMMLPIFLLILPRIGLRSGLPDRWALLRGAFEVGVALAFLTALRLMPLGDTYALYFSAPILLTATAALLGGETVGARRWIAVLIGFAGMLVCLGPPTSWTTVSLLPLMAAALSVGRDLATRRVDPAIGAATVSLTSATMLMLVGMASLPLGWAPVAPSDLAFCLLAAVGASAGYVLFVLGIRQGELSFVAPFRYAAVPVAMLLDIVAFGIVPSVAMALGAAIIMGSGLMILLGDGHGPPRTK